MVVLAIKILVNRYPLGFYDTYMSGFFKTQLLVLLFPFIAFSQKKAKNILRLVDEDVKYLEISARRVNANLFRGGTQYPPTSSLDLSINRVFKVESIVSENAAVGYGLNFRNIQNGIKTLGLSGRLYANDAFGVQNLGVYEEVSIPILGNKRNSKIEMVDYTSKTEEYFEGLFIGFGVYYVIAENHLIDLTLTPVGNDFLGKFGGAIQYTYRIPYTRGKRYLAKKAKKCPDL